MTEPTKIPAVAELHRVADIIAQRDLTHGDAETNFSDNARRWSAYLGIKLSPADVAVMMIDLKMSRMGAGGIADEHLEDIAGYAALAMTLSVEPVGVDTRKHRNHDHPPVYKANTEPVVVEEYSPKAREYAERMADLEVREHNIKKIEAEQKMVQDNLVAADLNLRERVRYHNNQVRLDPLYVPEEVTENIEDLAKLRFIPPAS